MSKESVGLLEILAKYISVDVISYVKDIVRRSGGTLKEADLRKQVAAEISTREADSDVLRRLGEKQIRELPTVRAEDIKPARRKITPEGRKRMAEAQKRRWAKQKRKTGAKSKARVLPIKAAS